MQWWHPQRNPLGGCSDLPCSLLLYQVFISYSGMWDISRLCPKRIPKTIKEQLITYCYWWTSIRTLYSWSPACALTQCLGQIIDRTAFNFVKASIELCVLYRKGSSLQNALTWSKLLSYRRWTSCVQLVLVLNWVLNFGSDASVFLSGVWRRKFLKL